MILFSEIAKNYGPLKQERPSGGRQVTHLNGDKNQVEFDDFLLLKNGKRVIAGEVMFNGLHSKY